MVTRYRKGDPDPSCLPGWLTPLRLSFAAVVATPLSVLTFVHIALTFQPRVVFLPAGLSLALMIGWNWPLAVRTWRKDRDDERERIVRDVMES